MMRELLRTVLPVFVLTRAGALVVGFLALAAFGYAQGAPPVRYSENELLNLPFRFDAGWYLDIAVFGYRWDPAATTQQNIAFFPAYPMLTRFAMAALPVSWLPAALLVSLAAGLAAFSYLYRLARLDLDSDSAAASIVLMAAYPFAVFFSAPYTESLFLLAVVGTWYHFRREQWIRACCFGLLAGLVRPNGCFLSVPLAVMAIGRPGGVWKRLLVAGAPGVGMLIYSTYIYVLTGNPLQWSVAHEAWGRDYTPAAATLTGWWNAPSYFFEDVGAAAVAEYLSGIAFFTALGTIVPVWRRFGPAAALFIPLNLLPPLFMGGLLSMGRLTATMFPMFLWLGAAIPARHRTAWIALFAMLQALAAALFFTWRPLY